MNGLRPPVPQLYGPGWKRVWPPHHADPGPGYGFSGISCGKGGRAQHAQQGTQQGPTKRRGPGPFRGWTIREKAHSRGIHIWDKPELGPAL